MVPQLARVAILYNPDSAPAAGTFFLTPFVGAAREFKVQPITAQVRNPAEIESTIAKLGSQPRSGLIVMPDNFTSVHRKLIISLAAQFRIPTIYPYRYFADEGGLLSYGVDTSTCSGVPRNMSVASFAVRSRRIFPFRRRRNSNS